MAVFFLDRNFARSTAAALVVAGADVVLHYETYADDADDEEWIPMAAARGWAIVSADDRIRYVPAEQRAVQMAGARLFVFVGCGNLGTTARTAALLKALPKMVRLADDGGSFIAKIYQNGDVEIWRRFSPPSQSPPE